MRDAAGAGSNRHRLTREEVRGLWLERAVSLQCSTGNGEMYVPALAEGVPRWFVGAELGMAIGAGPAFVDVQANVGEQNHQRRLEHEHTQAQLTRAFIAEAKSRGLRTFIRPPESLRGCTSCPSCVSDARLRPRRSALHGRAPSWTPGSLTPQQRAVVSFLNAGAAYVRRLHREDTAVRQFLRAGAKLLRRLHAEERAKHHDGARAALSSRRSKAAAERRRAREVAAKAGLRVVDGHVVAREP